MQYRNSAGEDKAYYREYFGFRIQGFLPDHHEAVGQVEHEEDDAPSCRGYVGPEIIFDGLNENMSK